MEKLQFGYFILMIILSILSITVTSIAIECYKSNENENNNDANKFNLLAINLTISIIMLLINFVFLWNIYKGKPFLSMPDIPSFSKTSASSVTSTSL
jgi:hypothetical protein